MQINHAILILKFPSFLHLLANPFALLAGLSYDAEIFILPGVQQLEISAVKILIAVILED